MKECDAFIELLSMSLDGPMSLKDRQALDAHLEQCPECRQLSMELTQLRDELRALPEADVPQGFTQGVMDKIRTLDEKPVENAKVIPIRRHRQFKQFGSIAACALLCFGIWRMGLPQMDQNADIAARSAPAAAQSTPAVQSAPAEAVQSPAAVNMLEEDLIDPSTIQAAPPAPDASAPIFQAAAAAPDHQSKEFSTSRLQTYLLDLVQDALGQQPGVILMVEKVPQELEGSWYTAADGTQFFLFEGDTQDPLWQNCFDRALAITEYGDGPAVLILHMEPKAPN